MLKQDPTFNTDKLKQILYGSEEYNRLEKTQSNQVYSNLIGGVTDRQITLITMTHYKAVTGKEGIDPSELVFLKKKLVDFNLDEVIFRKFLENYMNDIPFNQEMIVAEKIRQYEALQAKTSQESPPKADPKPTTFDTIKKELYTQLYNELTGNKQGYTDQKGVEHAVTQEQPNRQVIEVLLKTSAASERTDNYLDSSDVLDSIKKQASCVFSKDMKNQQDQQKSMAELINQRNNQNLKDTCVRNKTYLGLDEDMVLDPALRWSLPPRRSPVCVGGKNKYQPMIDQSSLIGTLLDDAKSTKVGDVVDFLPPK
jgi:hypothetical protein